MSNCWPKGTLYSQKLDYFSTGLKTNIIYREKKHILFTVYYYILHVSLIQLGEVGRWFVLHFADEKTELPKN